MTRPTHAALDFVEQATDCLHALRASARRFEAACQVAAASPDCVPQRDMSACVHGLVKNLATDVAQLQRQQQIDHDTFYPLGTLSERRRKGTR